MVFFLTSIRYAATLLGLARDRWSWAVLLSPSAGVCASSVFFTLAAPLAAPFSLAGILTTREWSVGKRYGLFIVGLLVFVASMFVAQAVIWGSFPLDIDQEGHGHLRMIPFLPWPDRKYLEF
jgi:hypothetical protein